MGDQPFRSTGISDRACRLLAACIPHPKSNGLAHDDRSLCSARVSSADRPCNGARTSAVAEPFRVQLGAAACMQAAVGQQPFAEVAVRFAAARTMPTR
jgi:hypothetical protein